MINEYCFDKLIIGGSLESLLYSYYTNTNILLLNSLYPFELLTFEYLDELRLLGYADNEIITKSEMWDRLSFLLSMAGLNVCPNIVSSHREKENKFILATERNKRVSVHSDHIIYFDEIKESPFRVYDWFNVRSGNNHNHTLLIDEEHKFVKNIHFYKPARVGGNRQMKDLVAESILSDKEIDDINYAEGLVRLKVLRMMKESGIRGQSNGVGKNGIKNHYALKIEHTHRTVKRDYTPKYTAREIVKFDPTQENQWKFTKNLFRHKIITTLQESFRLPASL